MPKKHFCIQETIQFYCILYYTLFVATKFILLFCSFAFLVFSIEMLKRFLFFLFQFLHNFLSFFLFIYSLLSIIKYENSRHEYENKSSYVYAPRCRSTPKRSVSLLCRFSFLFRWNFLFLNCMSFFSLFYVLLVYGVN